jgi:hypothetical protein
LWLERPFFSRAVDDFETVEGSMKARVLTELDKENELPGYQIPGWRWANYSQSLRRAGYNEDHSFLDGRRVPYGTLGSVRPEVFRPGRLWGWLRRSECVDVRSADVTTSVRRYRLVRLAVEQARQRVNHLPRDTVYKIVIDAREQNISLQQLDVVIERIVTKSNGLMPKFNVLAMR